METGTQQRVKPLVISWGPCGGKSSILPHLVETLLQQGYDVYTVPEMATYLESKGIHPKYGTPLKEFQINIVEQQLLHEQTIQEEIARRWRPEKSVILCDRGLVDNLAYVDAATYTEVLAACKLSLAEVLNRYGGAVLLQTAAYGAEEFYTTDNNAARLENTIEAARVVEDNVLHAYDNYHGKQFFVSNTHPSTWEKHTFEAKKQAASNAILSLLGSPAIEYERQFEVRSFDKEQLFALQPTQFFIEQYYLPIDLFKRPDFDEARIRHMYKVWSTDHYYFLTLKKRQGDQRIEEEHVISAEQYEQYLSQKLATKQGIQKHRYVFRNPLDHHRYEFDIFLTPNWQETGRYRLEVELPWREVGIALPTFITDSHETTGDQSFSNFNSN